MKKKQIRINNNNSGARYKSIIEIETPNYKLNKEEHPYLVSETKGYIIYRLFDKIYTDITRVYSTNDDRWYEIESI